jgi:hypothetical protein
MVVTAGIQGFGYIEPFLTFYDAQSAERSSVRRKKSLLADRCRLQKLPIN